MKDENEEKRRRDKIKDEWRKWKKERELLGFSPALAGASAGVGAQALGGAVAWPLLKKLLEVTGTGREIPPEAWGEPIEELAEFTGREARAIKRFAKEQGVRIPIIGAPHSYYYDDVPSGDMLKKVLAKLRLGKAPEVYPAHIGLSSTSLPVAFHEIGHASPIMGSHKARRAWQTAELLSRGGRYPIRVGLLASALATPEEDDSGARKFLHEHAPGLMGASFVPMLLEEARASGHAVRGAGRHGIGALKALKEVAPAYGTYAAGTTAAIMGTVLAKKLGEVIRDALIKRKEDEEKEEKTAALSDEGRAAQALRIPASAAWRMGSTVGRPKTTPPTTVKNPVAKGTPLAKPPTKLPFFKDYIASLNNPARSFRPG